MFSLRLAKPTNSDSRELHLNVPHIFGVDVTSFVAGCLREVVGNSWVRSIRVCWRGVCIVGNYSARDLGGSTKRLRDVEPKVAAIRDL